MCYAIDHVHQIRHPKIYTFLPLKDAPRGLHFRSDEEVKEAVHGWLAQQQKDFFSTDIYALWNFGGVV
jgi:hypothetical protein